MQFTEDKSNKHQLDCQWIRVLVIFSLTKNNTDAWFLSSFWNRTKPDTCQLTIQCYLPLSVGKAKERETVELVYCTNNAKPRAWMFWYEELAVCILMKQFYIHLKKKNKPTKHCCKSSICKDTDDRMENNRTRMCYSVLMPWPVRTELKFELYLNLLSLV